jgi:hypothetical protein
MPPLDLSRIYMGIVVPLAIIIPLGIALYKYGNLPGAYKILTWYLVIAGITNFTANILATRNINNLPLLHIYTALEFLVLSVFYRSVLKDSLVTKLILPVLVLFVIFCVVNALFFQTIFLYNSYSRSLSAFILVVYAIVYFKQRLDQGHSISKHNRPLLWINSALLIYFGGSFFLFISSNLILANITMNAMLWDIHASLVFVMYILFTIGFSNAKRN